MEKEVKWWEVVRGREANKYKYFSMFMFASSFVLFFLCNISKRTFLIDKICEIVFEKARVKSHTNTVIYHHQVTGLRRPHFKMRSKIFSRNEFEKSATMVS